MRNINSRKTETQNQNSRMLREHLSHVKEYSLYNCTNGSNKPILVKVIADGAELQMEVDTGATSSIISKKTYKKIW